MSLLSENWIWILLGFRVLVLERGEVIELDSPANLLADEQSMFASLVKQTRRRKPSSEDWRTDDEGGNLSSSSDADDVCTRTLCTTFIIRISFATVYWNVKNNLKLVAVICHSSCYNDDTQMFLLYLLRRFRDSRQNIEVGEELVLVCHGADADVGQSVLALALHDSTSISRSICVPVGPETN